MLSIAALMVLASVFDMTTEKVSGLNEGKKRQKSVASELLLTFSVPGNVERVMKTASGGADFIGCLNGMRCIQKPLC